MAKRKKRTPEEDKELAAILLDCFIEASRKTGQGFSLTVLEGGKEKEVFKWPIQEEAD